MINHARTLLINRSGRNQSLLDLGEEYIPTSFRAQTLPPWLKNIHSVLFGSDPDNTYRNYVADQVLRVVHATDYEPFLLLHDKRITYDAKSYGAFSTVKYGLTHSSTAQVREISHIGDINCNDLLGQTRNSYKFVLNNTGTVTLTNLKTLQTKTENISRGASETLTNEIQLPGSLLKVKFSMTVAVASWDDNGIITVLARPQRSLASKFESLQALSGFDRKLFGTSAVQPYRTFYNLWLQDNCLSDKIAGFILALVYRLHDLNVNNA